MTEAIQPYLEAFKSYSPNSKIWIYQADRILSEQEVDTLESAMKQFVSGWAAHGKELEAGFAIFFNTFIILVVDEQKEKASGCSIDSSVRVVKELGKQLNVDFFNRFAIAYIQGEEFNCVTKEQFQSLVNQSADNIWVFNNTLTMLSDLYNQWLVPFESSWHKTYFSGQSSFSLSL